MGKEQVGLSRVFSLLVYSYKFSSIRERKISRPADIVGFGLLPNQVKLILKIKLVWTTTWWQVYRKAVKKGFEFSLMVVGESGLGKSTMVWNQSFFFILTFFLMAITILEARYMIDIKLKPRWTPCSWRTSTITVVRKKKKQIRLYRWLKKFFAPVSFSFVMEHKWKSKCI